MGPRIPCGHEDRPELCSNAACGEAWHVGVVVVERLARVGAIEVGFGANAQRPRQIVVSVDHWEVGMNSLGSLGEISHR
jgi:hypothetical protein